MSLYIPKTKELKELASYLKISNEELITIIEKGFKKIDFKFDEKQDPLKTIDELLNEQEVCLTSFSLLFLRRSDNKVKELLSKVYFKNDLNDCEECGCETRKEQDYDEHYKTPVELKRCTNASCSAFGREII